MSTSLGNSREQRGQRLVYLFDDIHKPPNDEPYLTVLNYSGGRQSHYLAMAVLRDEIEKPCRFIVVAADPGTEHADTVRMRNATFARLNAAGIPAIVCPGPKMLEDLRSKKQEGGSHIDQPPLYNSGQLPQHCTRHYKVRPMNRVVKAYLRHACGYQDTWKSTPPGFVERWIGFTWDEMHRRRKTLQKWGSEPDEAWQQPRFPLIEKQMTKEDVRRWYADNNEEMPPPSVCGHCPANGVQTMQRIFETDEHCWNRSVEYDELARDMSQFGVRETCFCSRTRKPLVQLAAEGFGGGVQDSQEWMCDSGACFM